MTPEEKARQKIDQWFSDAGWKVVDRDEYEPTCTAVAIREGLLKGNLEADYFLFINGKAVGVLEAKREETDAFSDKVCNQAVLYARNIRHIRNHCLLFLLQMAKICIFVISGSKIHVLIRL